VTIYRHRKSIVRRPIRHNSILECFEILKHHYRHRWASFDSSWARKRTVRWDQQTALRRDDVRNYSRAMLAATGRLIDSRHSVAQPSAVVLSLPTIHITEEYNSIDYDSNVRYVSISSDFIPQTVGPLMFLFCSAAGFVCMCVRLSWLLVGLRTHLKSVHFHLFIHSFIHSFIHLFIHYIALGFWCGSRSISFPFMFITVLTHCHR